MKTAEELALEMQENLGYDDLIDKVSFASLVAIEFAKLHCEAQLQAILKNIKMKEYEQGDESLCWVVDNMGDAHVLNVESIINAYLLNNIK